MKELNDSIYHEPGVGLVARIETETVKGYYTLQGLEALIQTERHHFRDVSALESARDDLSRADEAYQEALWRLLRRFSARVHPPGLELIQL